MGQLCGDPIRSRGALVGSRSSGTDCGERPRCGVSTGPIDTTDGQRYDSCSFCGKDRGERYSGFVSGGSGLPGGGLGGLGM